VDGPSNTPAALFTALPSGDIRAAIGIAIAVSLVFALIEIPAKAKTTRLRACLVGPSFFYWAVLSFGNTVTTLLASVAVVKMLPSLSDYYFLLSAFFGVFAFESVLKNTNITMFDKGVLTIQNWIDKALDAAAAATIDRQETMKHEEETRLVQQLRKKAETEINTRILNKMGDGKVEALDNAAQASGADRQLYKIYQLVTILTSNERAALLKELGAPSVTTPSRQNLPNGIRQNSGSYHDLAAITAAITALNVGTQPSDMMRALTLVMDRLKIEPFDRTLVITAARLQRRLGDLNAAITTSLDFIERKRAADQVDKDYADVLYNISCYHATLWSECGRNEDNRKRSLEALKQSIAISPSNKTDAASEVDFYEMKTDPEFIELLKQ
jgi:hypothetical protein